MSNTKRYWANCIIDRHGLYHRPYHQSHSTCCLNIEEAREIINKIVAKGGVLLSYIQEYEGDNKEPNILELQSYVGSINIKSREIRTVKEFSTYVGDKPIVIYEVDDDVWSPRIKGKELYNGPAKNCPSELLERGVMKVFDDEETNSRNFIVFKEDEVL